MTAKRVRPTYDDLMKRAEEISARLETLEKVLALHEQRKPK